MMEREITKEEIERAIDKLKCGKAPRMDCFMGEFYKEFK